MNLKKKADKLFLRLGIKVYDVESNKDIQKSKNFSAIIKSNNKYIKE